LATPALSGQHFVFHQEQNQQPLRQNMPLEFKMMLGGPSETFPWQLSSRTYNSQDVIKYIACVILLLMQSDTSISSDLCMEVALSLVADRCFGRFIDIQVLQILMLICRSAWCPQPEERHMRGFPRSMKETAKQQDFYLKAKKLLNVENANQINDDIFGALQEVIDERLQKGLGKLIEMGHIVSAIPAPLAVGKQTSTTKLRFNKFSTPGPLLHCHEEQRNTPEASPLDIVTDCVVERFYTEGDKPSSSSLLPESEPTSTKAVALRTSRGDLFFPEGKTNIIIATGAIPATTILLNSLPKETSFGSRLTGHFVSHITARFRRSGILDSSGPLKGSLQIGASYLEGTVQDRQYHIQITSMNSQKPIVDAEDAARECPDYAASATNKQLEGSEEYIVLSEILGLFSIQVLAHRFS
jgi:hypothetical protein